MPQSKLVAVSTVVVHDFSKRGYSMKVLKKVLILLLIFSLWNFGVPRFSFSQVGTLEPEITKHAPEMRSSPEQNYPGQESEKRKTWVWWVLGGLAVAGAIGLAAAAAGGGGGGNGSTVATTNSGNGGSVTVGW